MFHANCNPILIGSLPIVDHREAIDLIFQHSSAIPLWPQLPKNEKEGMVRQFVTGFPGLIDDGNRCYVDTSIDGFEEEMVAFYEDVMRIEEQPDFLCKSRFALGRDSAIGFFHLIDYLKEKNPTSKTVKGQITGPVTTGIGIKDQNGKPIIYDDNLRDMLITMLCLKARYQVIELQKFTGTTPPVVMIDEPSLVSFGSTAFSGVSMQMVSDAVATVISDIQTSGGLAGVHICANGDWGPALLSGADIISFDAYFYFDNFVLYREQLTSFLQRGGILAWGIVPTGDPQVVEKESTNSLFTKWREQLSYLADFGFTEKQLMQQTLIAPSCGTGSLTQEQAVKVLSMTDELSKRAILHLQDQ